MKNSDFSFSQLEMRYFQNSDDRSTENDSAKTHSTLRLANLS